MEDVLFFVQNEIKTLLFEYLTDNEMNSSLNAPFLSIKDVITDKKQKVVITETIKKVILKTNNQ